MHSKLQAEAAVSANGATPAEAASGEGATIETGAGPGAPEEEVDPQTQAWMNAVQNPGTRSASVAADSASSVVGSNAVHPA